MIDAAAEGKTEKNAPTSVQFGSGSPGSNFLLFFSIFILIAQGPIYQIITSRRSTNQVGDGERILKMYGAKPISSVQSTEPTR